MAILEPTQILFIQFSFIKVHHDMVHLFSKDLASIVKY